MAKNEDKAASVKERRDSLKASKDQRAFSQIDLLNASIARDKRLADIREGKVEVDPKSEAAKFVAPTLKPQTVDGATLDLSHGNVEGQVHKNEKPVQNQGSKTDVRGKPINAPLGAGWLPNDASGAPDPSKPPVVPPAPPTGDGWSKQPK